VAALVILLVLLYVFVVLPIKLLILCIVVSWIRNLFAPRYVYSYSPSLHYHTEPLPAVAPPPISAHQLYDPAKEHAIPALSSATR